MPEFYKIKENQVLKNTVEDVVSALHTAKSETLASIDSREYGVYFDSNQIIIFKGDIYVIGDLNNNIIEIINPASITNVTLGGVSLSSGELFFDRLSGEPNVTGTITISTENQSKIITISPSGSVSVN